MSGPESALRARGRAWWPAVVVLMLATLVWGGWSRANEEKDLTSSALPSLDTVLAGLEHRERLIRSAQGEFTWRMVDSNNPEHKRLTRDLQVETRKPYARSRSYLWAFQGQCWREETRALSGMQEHHVVAYDGELGRYYSPLRRQGVEVATKFVPRSVVMSEFGRWLDIPLPLNPADQSLSSRLRRMGAQLVGSEPVGDVPCYRLEAQTDPLRWVHRWWIAPSLDYLLMRRDTIVPWTASSKREGVEASRETLLTEEVERYDGVAMPKLRRLTSYLEMADGRSVRGGGMEVAVHKLVVNRELPPDTFNISFPPGTTVVSPDKLYVVPD